MMKRIFVWLLVLGFILPATGFAQQTSQSTEPYQGMWLPLKVKDLNYDEMKEMGCEVPVDDIYNEEKASLEDAIVKLNGGSCTAEMISSQGLMLTNHHCAYDGIATLSSEDNDLLTDGFWAYSKGDELPVPGGTAAFLVHSEDVTSQLMEAGENAEEKLNELMEAASQDGKYEVEVKDMFNGTEIYIFAYEIYRDVRLVGAPPSSIGKFGFDTDNWMWPRHTGDFALLRVYAGPDNSPAAYSPDNVPYQPRHFLPISIKGVHEGDYAMVMGYPGSTTRYLTSSAIALALDQSNLDKIQLMGQKAKIMKKFMDKDDHTRITLASDYASLMNTYKYYIGQTEMMDRYDVVGEKKAEEAEFQAWAESDSARNEAYGELLATIETIHERYKPIDHFVNYLYYGALFSDATVFTYQQLADLRSTLAKGDQEKIDERFEEGKEAGEEYFKNYFKGIDEQVFTEAFVSFYNNVPSDLHPEVFDQIINPAPKEEVAEDTGKKKKKRKKKKKDETEMEEGPVLTEINPEERIRAWSKKAFETSLAANKDLYMAFIENPNLETIENDPILKFVSGLLNFYTKKIALADATFDYQIDILRREYLKGLREMYSDQNFYPDANSTMRLTYGKVRSYEPKDGVLYNYYTTLAGVMEKEDPNDEEFIVPGKLKELWQKGDYGQYAEDGEMRVNFLTTNDITGGNSGSPVINANGELVGVAFDGNWEAMAGDIHVFPQFNRTICVDARYVLFVIEKYAGAKNLIEELKIVK
ncbi:MAG: S46 family peptidase [Bacteroidetes bacterium]|nr:S46 family peptidase [Bacteroidota bacterium]MCB0844974.1 S46 family peptidase [Bacteroidota bacterium]